MTIKDKYIIYDWKYSYTSIKWLWVALTRCSNIENIYFYDGDDNLTSIKNNVSISSYKEQDKKACRKYDLKDYIDMSWINLQLKK
jgi:hypothetical protein